MSARRSDTPEARAFWARLDRVAEELARLPEHARRERICDPSCAPAPTPKENQP